MRTIDRYNLLGIDSNNVETYYGIPYGTANRWEKPIPYTYSKDLDCSVKEEIALQLHHGNIEGVTDCLNLDVYTKKDADNLPVLVFFHGGNNQTGSSYGELTGEKLVVEDDCVVVCLNHRLGLLGFNALPSIAKDTGNFTVLDIALALQWVQKYIKNFGGNPDNVTISGFSAGGRNVMACLISPLFKGLFHKAIAFSGGMTLTDPAIAAKKQAEMMSSIVMEDKGFSKEEAITYLLQDNEEVREYLYSIDDIRLTYLNEPAGIRMAIFPHLFTDNIVFPKSGFNGPYINDVPIMLLTGTSEFSMFGLYDPYFKTLEEPVKSSAIAFMSNYGSNFYRIFNGQLSAKKMLESGYNSPVYVTEINYGNSTSEYPIQPAGSYHGIFVPMLCHNEKMMKMYDFTQPSYASMATLFNTSLKSFLFSSNPNWPEWTLENKQVAVFDAKDNHGIMDIKNTYTDNQTIIESIEKDPLDETIKKTIIQTILNGRWFSDDLDEHFNTPSLW